MRIAEWRVLLAQFGMAKDGDEVLVPIAWRPKAERLKAIFERDIVLVFFE